MPNASLASSPSDAPTPEQARAMQARVLARWASDALRLRRAALDRPTWRTGWEPHRPILAPHHPRAA
ncbi:MAG: hypothetical protein RBS39_14065 [Phycisphaerales bacterium]|nr:hypothetical protein [Phycisphaerales bacterium]